MKTRITETRQDLFISPEQSERRYGTNIYCGNYEIVVRTKWFQIWKFWLPYKMERKIINVDGKFAYYALGCNLNFNNHFKKEFKI